MKILVPIIALVAMYFAWQGLTDDTPVKQREVPKENVFDPMVSTMDRAAGVEDMNFARKDEMDAAIEANE